MRHNSTIFKNPQDQHLFDLSSIGSINHEDKSITINQEEHYFKVGEVLYYDVTTNKFSRAVAVNNIESEACGIVSEIIDKDNFVIIAKGLLETDKYNFSVGSKLYLSDVKALHPRQLRQSCWKTPILFLCHAALPPDKSV